MPKTTKQIESEIQALKQELSVLSSKSEPSSLANEGNVATLFKQMVEERERTNKILMGIATRISQLEKEIDTIYSEDTAYPEAEGRRQIPVSGLDAKILNYIQSKEMVCADEVKVAMSYKGRNAACSRLNKLHRLGVLERFQLGHKVYYKYDAGRATDILIISPPQ